MKKQLLFILITVLSINCYSQISFEKGYYIDNTGQKIDCLIKNIDWLNNPTEFEYILKENDEPKKGTIKLVKEFGVYNISEYSRNTVNIDRSSEKVKNLSEDKNPIFKKEQLFLKVLVKGKSNLYEYVDGNLVRYFYNKENSDVEQLIFKNYKVKENNNIGENNRFRQQLWTDLKCSSITMKKTKNLDYKKNDLVSFFVEYNECNNQKYTNFVEKQKKDLFNLNVRPGFNSSSLSIQNITSKIGKIDFDNELGFRFGVEAEFIMPFNKNKWAIIIEPTYQYYKSEIELTDKSYKAEYTSVELPIGVRHYFFLNDNSKIFINASYVIDLSSNSIIEQNPGVDLDIETSNNTALGIGYKHNDKFSLEFRYYTSRDVLYHYSFWGSDYNTMSVIFGYSLF